MWVQPPGEKQEYNLDGSQVKRSNITQNDKTITSFYTLHLLYVVKKNIITCYQNKYKNIYRRTETCFDDGVSYFLAGFLRS